MLYSTLEESMLMFIKRPLKSKYITKFMFIRMLYFGYESCDPTRARKTGNRKRKKPLISIISYIVTSFVGLYRGPSAPDKS